MPSTCCKRYPYISVGNTEARLDVVELLRYLICLHEFAQTKLYKRLLIFGKMTNIVALLFVLVASVIERSNGISCYSCQENTCAEPFNAASASKCDGSICSLLLIKTSGQYDSTSVYRACAIPSTTPITYEVSRCMTYNDAYKQLNYTFFTYGSGCCYTYSGSALYGWAQQVTTCLCQKDNCNGALPGNIPNYSGPPSPAEHNMSNAGFSLAPVSKSLIGVIAMMTVLSKIS